MNNLFDDIELADMNKHDLLEYYEETCFEMIEADGEELDSLKNRLNKIECALEYARDITIEEIEMLRLLQQEEEGETNGA